MLYYLFDYINELYAPPGFGVFKFLSFRSSLAAITALFLAFYVGPKIIEFLRRKQIGESFRKSWNADYGWNNNTHFYYSTCNTLG